MVAVGRLCNGILLFFFLAIPKCVDLIPKGKASGVIERPFHVSSKDRTKRGSDPKKAKPDQ